MNLKTFCKSLLFFIGVFFIVASTNTISANPVLQVSVSPQIVLLGGQAQYTVTVENTDTNDKGYNLSLSHIFSSDRDDAGGPEGVATFSSASDQDGNLVPTTRQTNPVTGDTTITFANIRDLAPQETYSFTITMDLAGDTTWEAMDDVIHDVTASINAMPDGSGTDVTGQDIDTSDVLPIALVHKTVNQSTGVGQVTGTHDRAFSYAIEVQNNYINDSDHVVVTDTLPDGIEFLGVTSGHTCSDTRADDTGITTIVCNLGTLGNGDNETIKFDAGIRYDYYGTDHGGTNRVHDDWTGNPVVGTPIPDTTVLTNHVDMDAEYDGENLATQSSDASVTAGYATVNKTGHIAQGGNGEVINFTLTYTTSEYYDIIDDDTDDNDSSITLHDLLPDGLTYNDNANPEPSSLIVNSDGTTDLYWNSSVLDGLAHSDSFTVTFSATVDDFWDDGAPIVGADYISNTVESRGEWDDLVDTNRDNAITQSSASAGYALATPKITKEVEYPQDSNNWVDAVDATIGDQLKFRVRFNTNDGVSPDVSNIKLGDIVVADWLPLGTIYNGDAVMTYSSDGDFSGSNYDTDPHETTSGSFDGLEWELGDVSEGGWWQAIFTVTIDDASYVENDQVVSNLWKMTGFNTDGSAYSDRDNVEIAYSEPELILTKDVSYVPSPLIPGSTVGYEIAIENIGGAPARDVIVTDTLAQYMRDTAPVITSIAIDGTALASEDYKLDPVYDSGTGIWTIDLTDVVAPTVTTEIPAGQTLTVTYNAVVNDDVGMGAQMTNVATVGYGTQHDGSGRNVSGTSSVSDDNTDDAMIQMTSPSIDKSAPTGPYVIGNMIPYTVRVTVPAHQVLYWPNIRDVIDQDGVAYVSNSAALTTVSGTPDVAATFAGGNDPVISGNVNTENQTVFLWNLMDSIDNRLQGSDYVFELTYVVQYTGVEDDGNSWEFFTPTSDDRVTNRADLWWSDYDNATRVTNHNFSDTAVIDIDQPLLTTTKEALTAGPYTANTTIDYRVIIENVGQATAYDIIWEDDVSDYVENFTLTSVVHTNTSSISTTLVADDDYIASFGANPLTMDFNGNVQDVTLNVGEKITLLYSVQVSNDVGAGFNVSNTADVDWSTQNGGVSGERVYNDAAPESSYVGDTATVSASVNNATFVKTQIAPISGDVTVGDEVTYNIHVEVPAETVMYSPTIEDIVTSDGLEYVDNSVVILNESGNPDIGATLTTQPTINTTSPSPGTTLVFTFDTTIDNSDTSSSVGDSIYEFDVQYRMRAIGVADGGEWVWNPSSQNTVANAATGKWYDGSANHAVTTPNATVDIVQPYLDVEKTFDVETVIGSDVVFATVHIENIGTSTAYEYDDGPDFIDVMPVGFLNPHNFVVTHSVNGTLTDSVDYTVTINDNDFSIEYNSAQTDLIVGAYLTITYNVDIDPNIGAGSNIANVVDVDYSSLSGNQIYERDYDDTDSFDGTADESSDNVMVDLAGLTKVTNLGDGTATIGEEFDYIITVPIPQNTTLYNAVVTDTVPDGLTVVSSPRSMPSSTGTIITAPEVNGTTLVTWNVGDISNDPTDELVLTIPVRLDDTYDSGIALNGLVGDGDDNDLITNEARVTWDTTDTGGQIILSNDVDFQVVEPEPTITKDVSVANATIGDTITYTVELGNDGVSDLHNIVFEDTLDALLFVAGDSPSITSIVHSTDGALSGVYDFDNATNPMTITFDSSVVLAPTETITITYTAIVSASAHSGDNVTNTARISNASSLSGENAFDRTYVTSPVTTNVTIITPDLTITNTDGDVTANPGDAISYTLAYENIGGVVASNTVITQTVPMHTQFDSDNSTVGWVCTHTTSNSVCTFDLGDVPVSGTGSVVFAVTVDDPLAPGVNVILNTTSITDDGTHGSDPTPLNNIAPESTPLSGFVDLSITKDDGGVGVIQGDSVAYTLTYANNGDQNATGVTITEVVSDHTSFDAELSTSGWNCAGTGAGSVCTFNAGNVIGGASSTVTFAVMVDDPMPDDTNEIINTTTISDDGTSGADANEDDNSAMDTTPIIFDPPSAIKTVNVEGLPEVEWKMVWINKGNSRALDLRVIDEIPVDTTYVLDSIVCDARGTSTTDYCGYDSGDDNRIRWEGVIGADAGHVGEDDAINEVVITFRTTVPEDILTIENQGQAYWDADGDGAVDDEVDAGQAPVTTDDPTTDDNLDPTTWERIVTSGNSSIGNYIWHDKDGDGTQDDDEKGLENIRVKLTWAGLDGKFGTNDDQVWRTDTNHNGHYLFENLPAGKYKVKVKDDDVRGWIQTYDPGSTMNGKSIVTLGVNDHHTKADFGYNMTEERLARTGDNVLLIFVMQSIVVLLGSVWFIWGKKVV